MKNKDNFILGLLIAAAGFFVIYSILILITNHAFFSRSDDSLWVYILSLIPGLLLSRFMLVKWDLEKTGRGMMFFSLLGIVLVMFFVLR